MNLKIINDKLNVRMTDRFSCKLQGIFSPTNWEFVRDLSKFQLDSYRFDNTIQTQLENELGNN